MAINNHDELEHGMDAIIQAFGQGLSAKEAFFHLLRATKHDVILTPDDEIITITDAPAIELPDGRKYKADGTVYDG